MILRKISKFDVTRCPILRLKCTKFDFRWGFAPDPAEERTALPQTPYLYLRSPTSKGKRGYRDRKGRKGRGKGEEGEGKGFAGPTPQPFLFFFRADYMIPQTVYCYF